MRIIKQLATFVSLTFLMPVAIVAVLGLAVSPFQAAAEMPHERIVLAANDIPWMGAGEPDSQLVADEGVQAQEAQADLAIAPRPEESEEPIDLVDLEESETLNLSDEVAAYVESETSPAAGYYTSDQLRDQGVIFDGGYRYTWYSQRVLPGGGLAIEGRHVTDEGYVADFLGRIVVASSDIPYGTEIVIPFGSGTGIVLDTGCASGTIDVYTDF